MNKANKKISVSELIEANKTLRKSKTPAELLVRSLTLLYTKAEKLAANVFAEFGITIAQYNILALLAEEDNKINQLTISKRMLVSPGNITRILDKLVAMYEKNYKTAPKGKSFTECYDVQKLTPTQEYLDVYDEAVKILTDLGLDYWSKQQ